MPWNPVWEEVFKSRAWGKYPPEELIRFVARNFYAAPDRSEIKILEVGCGTGANMWYLAREGFSAYGIDGSATGIEIGKHRLTEEGLKANWSIGDISDSVSNYSANTFDAVIDVCCFQHNHIEAIHHILEQVNYVLKPGGKFFSMLVAADSYGAGTGEEITPGTFLDVKVGPLQGIGLVHFFKPEELEPLFRAFTPLHIEYSARSLNDGRNVYKHWVLEGGSQT